MNADVRRVFDFFLNAVGEEQPKRVSDRIRAYIRWQLPLPAAEQALLVLQEYLALRDAMTLEQHDLKVNAYRFSDEADLTASTLQQQKQKLLDMRSRYLSPEVDRAFYEEEDIFDDYTLSKLALMEDDEMSSADKSAAIASLEAGLPLAIQEQIVAVSRIQLLAKLRKTWQMEQGDAAGLRQLRESVVGAAAADRLEQLDQKRLNWHSRVDAWMQTRNHILAQEALAFQDRQAGVSRARAENFDTSELKRVQALEKLHDYSSVNGSQ
ncbi:MAG: hypothetical protein D9N11_10845 [Ketobacter sp.]|nr:MAG: hypothetical protein D9N11_10845 [Ketobacter sp.]